MVCLPHWNVSVNPRTTLVLAQCGHSVNSASCPLLPTGLLSRCPVQAHEGLQKAGTWVLKNITSLHWSQTHPSEDPIYGSLYSSHPAFCSDFRHQQIWKTNETQGSWNVKSQKYALNTLFQKKIKHEYLFSVSVFFFSSFMECNLAASFKNLNTDILDLAILLLEISLWNLWVLPSMAVEVLLLCLREKVMCNETSYVIHNNKGE